MLRPQGEPARWAGFPTAARLAWQGSRGEDLHRCLVVCPGSLAPQWQDELLHKFHLRFEIFTNDRIESAVSGNAFTEIPLPGAVHKASPIFSPIFSCALVHNVVAIAVATAVKLTGIINRLQIS
ncbi:hypothetical protein LC593_31575 [Nostoc sp. CHAB 5844]|nr:hypothetical protein [Nostoc sp. CHAB 5844]